MYSVSNFYFFNFDDFYIISRPKYASRVLEGYYKQFLLHKDNTYKNALHELDVARFCEMDVDIKNNKKYLSIFNSFTFDKSDLFYNQFLKYKSDEETQFFFKQVSETQKINLNIINDIIKNKHVDKPIYFIYRNPIKHFYSAALQNTENTLSDLNTTEIKSLILSMGFDINDDKFDFILSNIKSKNNKNIYNIYKRTKHNFFKILTHNTIVLNLKNEGLYHGHLGKYLSIFMPYLINTTNNINFINLDSEKNIAICDIFIKNKSEFINYFKFDLDSEQENLSSYNKEQIHFKINTWMSNKKGFDIVKEVLKNNNEINYGFYLSYYCDIIFYNILKEDIRNLYKGEDDKFI